MAGAVLGQGLLDTTDSRPLGASPTPHHGSIRSSSDYRQYGVERERRFPKDVRYSVHTEYSQPLGWISRSNDGRFIVDQDSSEDGGFTSPRRPVRCIQTRRVRPAPQQITPKPAWTIHEDAGVESGVYHVRAGTTSRLDHHQILPPRLSLRSDGSGASTQEDMPRTRIKGKGISQYTQWNTSFLPRNSPQFGRHAIPDSPRNASAAISPHKKVRTSSPRPLSSEWNQLAQLASFSEMSSVQQPSSVERSFPSTVLSSFQRTPSTYDGTPQVDNSRLEDPRFNSFRAMHNMYGQQLPSLSALHQSPHSRNFHIVGAQIHAPPSHHRPLIQRRQLPPYHSPPEHLWATPRRQNFMRDGIHYPTPHSSAVSGRFPGQYHQRTVRHPTNQYYPYEIGKNQRFHFAEMPKRQPYRVKSQNVPTYANVIRQPERRLLGSGQHIHSHQYGNVFGYIQSPVSDGTRHYVNIPPRRGNAYQRIQGHDPHYLLKPSSSENQKPLATSSPPRSRARHRPVPLKHHIKRSLPPPPTGVKPSTKHNVPEPQLAPKDTFNIKSRPYPIQDSDSSCDKPVTYTRERLQETIGLVRSGFFRSSGRHHSAPELSSAGRGEVPRPQKSLMPHNQATFRRGGSSVPGSRDASHELSQEQSPDSSSGFGSKNTSQQQSSSHSGQSLSALGLDSSRLDSSEVGESIEKPHQSWLQATGPRPQGHWTAQPPTYDQWLNRQVLPQFRLPGAYIDPSLNQPSSLLMEVPMEEHRNSVGESMSLDISGGSVMLPTPTISQLPPLDISVDGHYEFDTVLSPTPGEESDVIWSRTRIPSGDRGLSDSEIYGSGGRRRQSHESMEARVAAMKQEFHEYRQKQARRRRSREMESVC